MITGPRGRNAPPYTPEEAQWLLQRSRIEYTPWQVLALTASLNGEPLPPPVPADQMPPEWYDPLFPHQKPHQPPVLCTCGHARESHGRSTVDTANSCFSCGCWGFTLPGLHEPSQK